MYPPGGDLVLMRLTLDSAALDWRQPTSALTVNAEKDTGHRERLWRKQDNFN